MLSKSISDRWGLVSQKLAPDERWFLVYTLPKKELHAQLYLGLQNFRTYLPRMRKTIRHARKLSTVNAPLFPRYLFIVLDLTRDPWLSVSNTIGVSSLFICDGRPLPVPEGIVENLILAADGQNIIRLDDELRPGQRIRVLNGPFADLIGLVHRLDGPERVRILLDIMGGAVSFNVNRSTLARVHNNLT